MFRHRDNQITLDDLTLPLAFWQLQEPGYVLPNGAIGREYTPDTEHVVIYPVGMMGADLPWTDGDTYLSKVEQYEAAYTAYQAEQPPFVDGATFPRWQKLTDALRSSDLFSKAYSASTSAPGAWSLLLASLNSNSPADDMGRWKDFEFAIAQLRLALGEDDFTAEQVERFNNILAECQFDAAIV
ncbi:hypothetical protein H6F86_20725 [Phormidium sp. FACHB-592]|uniref:Uncharacterized protein n=1 Tax=Stenomitos frigidus AS-A4 TaxID=2933935 RepID=A0ABV0KEI7_9CYAN|nr:hypothetical protein [Phormidium sp. FACHB-592]MBD2076258.1 hypothetical protein [Phormidium sp. FACHB-592]